ncbi:MAG: calcium/proton exchanger [Anaerolineaceae bacterium]
MVKIQHWIKNNPLSILLLAFPLAILAEVAHWPQIWVFGLSAVGVIPMAGYIGRSTESLAAKTGPKIGGLLNATLGNAAELIITLAAVRAGLLELVKASLTGSILGNLLLVMGMALLAGGLKNGVQTFDRRQAGNHSVLLTLSILAMIVPSLFSHSIGPVGSFKVEELSLGVALVMIVLYIIGLVFSLRVSPDAISYPAEPETVKHPGYSLRTAIIILALSTAGVVVLSELLVGAVESVVENLGLSEFFLGIILIPIVGNVAEHLVAVQAAYRNHMNLSIEIAISSSLQIALFVAPLLVFISLAMGNPLTLIFNTFELIAMGSAVLVAALVSSDGESNWLEGAALLAVYVIFGLAFFLLPA